MGGFVEQLLKAMSEPVDMTPCCPLWPATLHHHWGRK